MSINDPEYSPDPYAHAVRHLDAAEDTLEASKYETLQDRAQVEALLGIGWALLAIAAHSNMEFSIDNVEVDDRGDIILDIESW